MSVRVLDAKAARMDTSYKAKSACQTLLVMIHVTIVSQAHSKILMGTAKPVQLIDVLSVTSQANASNASMAITSTKLQISV